MRIKIVKTATATTIEAQKEPSNVPVSVVLTNAELEALVSVLQTAARSKTFSFVWESQ
jgi:hypothetical protein